MDDLQKRIFAKTWPDYVSVFSENDGFLDRVYMKRLVDRLDYEELRTKRRTDILASIRDLLIGSKLGYEVYIDELKANHEAIYSTAKKLEGDEFKMEVFKDALIFGDVPRPPQYYIERTQKVQSIRDKMKELTTHMSNKIVLYGMNGIGKSTLATAAINDVDLLLDCFNNKVFWINVGNVDEQQLFDLMYRLYRKIILRDPELKKHMSLDKSIKLSEMEDNLLLLFQNEPYKRSLIILDNVCSVDVIKRFDHGCKLLIISHEQIFIRNEQVTYVSVLDGFTEEETYMIFAKALSTTYETIKGLRGPNLIFSWCKGHPMLTSLCASLLEERSSKLLKNPDQWKLLYQSLSKNKSVTEKLYETINLCFNNLDKDLQSKYQDFAVFVHDINITPEVLTVFWSLEKLEVEEAMEKLRNKCLIVSGYNDELRTDVYGIHHVFLDYLKRKLKEDTVVNLHRKLVKAYKEACNNDWSMLPNDNYIYQYIGYHFSNARMYEEFSIYFDLEFIGAKIKATGIADLLQDYKIHHEHIVKNDDTLQEKMENFTKFIEMFGQNLHEYQYTDIVQSALQLPKDNPVYKAAEKLARQQCDNRLFFKMYAPHESNYYTQILKLNMNFNAARFTCETNRLLIGTESGQIELWERQYMKKIQTYVGHNDSITYLKLNDQKDKFLSVSKDGTVKLWSLIEYPDHKTNEKIGYDNYIDSPSSKQIQHKTFFGNDDYTINTCKTLSVNDDNLVSAAFAHDYHVSHLIVTGSEKGRIVVWKNDTVIREISSAGNHSPIECVTFSKDDALVVLSVQYDIILYDVNTGEFLVKIRNKVKTKINALHVIPDTYSIISVQDSCITKHTWQQVQSRKENNGPKVAVMNLENRPVTCNEEHPIICSSITENFLVVGSSDSNIRMWDMNDFTMVQNFFDHNGKLICMDACMDETDQSIHILLTGSEAQIIKMWHVNTDEQSGIHINKNLPYAAHFPNTTTPNHSPLIAISNSERCIQVLRNHNLLAETDRLEYNVTALSFNCDGSSVYYGLKNGDVYIYHVKNKEKRKIMQLEDPVTYLEAICLSERQGLLAAATDTGHFSICRNGKCKMLVGFTDNSRIPVVPILKCYFLPLIGKLLTVSKQKMLIKSWDFEGNVRVLYGDTAESVVSATCMSQDLKCLCVTTNSVLQVFNIDYMNDDIVVSNSQVKELDSFIRCCSFSKDKSYLALGCENGHIVVWDVNKKRMFTTLKMHNTPIRNLKFSPMDAILVSVAESIAWWNISKIPESSVYRSRSNSARNSLGQLKNLEIIEPTQLLRISMNWSKKMGVTKDVPHLLSCFKFHGNYATDVTFSNDFDTFLTVDNQGEIYIMKVFDNEL